MTKPSRSKGQKSAAPQTAQLDAVRKLSSRGQDEQARMRVTQLRARYPDFKPLLALAWEVEHNAGNAPTACLHAWDWAATAHGSLAALEALRDSAFAAGFPALGASAAHRLAQAEGLPVADLPPLPGTLAEATFEQAVAIDLSRLFLSHGRFAQAIDALQGIDHPSARNNLALARFAQGDVAAALDIYETNWRQNERNLFALAHAVSLRLWRGGRHAAQEPAAALRAAQPQRTEDMYSKLFALLQLGEYAALLDAWRAAREAPFWQEGGAAEEAACACFAGVAALRTGDKQAAGSLFAEARALAPDNLDAALAAAALAVPELGGEADAAGGAFHDWFPQDWLAQLRSAAGMPAKETLLDALVRRCDAHPDHPTLVGHLAAIKDALGAGLDEIEALFGRAAELDPTYLFAQAGLARVAARKGEVERARELLAPLESREEYHYSEWRAILMAELEIARARQDLALMRELRVALQELAEQFR